MHQIMVQFGDVVPFLTNPDLGSPATSSYTADCEWEFKLAAAFADPCYRMHSSRVTVL